MRPSVKMNVIWISNLLDNLKGRFFRPNIEAVLIYGVTTLDIN